MREGSDVLRIEVCCLLVSKKTYAVLHRRFVDREQVDENSAEAECTAKIVRRKATDPTYAFAMQPTHLTPDYFRNGSASAPAHILQLEYRTETPSGTSASVFVSWCGYEGRSYGYDTACICSPCSPEVVHGDLLECPRCRALYEAHAT